MLERRAQEVGFFAITGSEESGCVLTFPQTDCEGGIAQSFQERDEPLREEPRDLVHLVEGGRRTS